MRTVKLIAVISIIALAIVGCASSHGTSPKGLEIPIEQAATKFVQDVKAGGYKTVRAVELKKWFDEGKTMTIISTLPAPEDTEFGMLPSAVNAAMPKTEKELTLANKDSILKVAEGDKSRTIVVYYGFVACRRSHVGAKILVDEGYLNVYRYPAGITGWAEMGYPLSK